MTFPRFLRKITLTMQEHAEQGSEGDVKVEPDGCSSPWCKHLPVQTGQHSPGRVTGCLQATLGQGARSHTTLPSCKEKNKTKTMSQNLFICVLWYWYCYDYDTVMIKKGKDIFFSSSPAFQIKKRKVKYMLHKVLSALYWIEKHKIRFDPKYLILFFI